MKTFSLLILLSAFFVSCGIKGDPVPPAKPFDWGQTKPEKKKENPSEN